jgi:RNA polymerase II C-terminal domain phosphatase-like 3/4
VKDAQTSFISTCRRLDNAMKLLEDLGRPRSSSNVNQSDGLPRDVPKLATKVFQGLRAVYAVWNTASGREQERDKDTFPRLLELVNGSYLKLFTPKQAREV